MSNRTELKKQKFLTALLISTSVKAACKVAHISKATAARYENDPDFQFKYHQLQHQAMEFAGNQLRSLTSKAIATLSAVMDDDNATPTEKTRAAKTVLDSAFHVQDKEDIIGRLDKLEKEMNADD